MNQGSMARALLVGLLLIPACGAAVRPIMTGINPTPPPATVLHVRPGVNSRLRRTEVLLPEPFDPSATT